MTPRRIADLDPRERRRAILRTGLTILLVWTVVISLYYLIPDQDYHRGSAIARLVIGVVLIVVFIAWQMRRIMTAELPELRAARALGGIIPVFLVVFALSYLGMSHASAHNFSEKLDHHTSLYFTVTVFSTVGFGDITAKSDGARLVVTVQMILDLVILGGVVQVLLSAARAGLGRNRAADGTADPTRD